jgi:GTPase Era involved in 16S rRNA processing
MEWTISFLSDQQIVVIQTQGIADESTSLEMAKNIYKTMNEYKVMRCLIDHRSIHSVSGNIANIYYRPRELREIGIPSKVKIAEVVHQEHKEHFDFLETVCRNRGFDFHIFEDQEKAIQWLMNEPQTGA